MSPVSAHDVAAELRRQLPGLPTKKLHKLLYHCQGHHLAHFSEPLVAEAVMAWDMGPVVAHCGRPRRRDVSHRQRSHSTLASSGLSAMSSAATAASPATISNCCAMPRIRGARQTRAVRVAARFASTSRPSKLSSGPQEAQNPTCRGPLLRTSPALRLVPTIAVRPRRCPCRTTAASCPDALRRGERTATLESARFSSAVRRLGKPGAATRRSSGLRPRLDLHAFARPLR